METIVVPFFVSQQEWGRLGLPGAMTAIEKVCVLVGIPHFDLHSLIPPISYSRETRI